VREAYVEALKQEIRLAAPQGGNFRTATVFFGGGTPSLLTGEQFTGIWKALREQFEFCENAEITVECNPGTLTPELLDVYRDCGVNRLSLGLQSADNTELKALGRIHTWEEFLTSYHLAREKGFSNLNVDLMSALPGQSRESWLGTLRKVLELSPEHISAYSLIIEEGTPFYERYGEPGGEKSELPDEDTERQMYYDTRTVLAAAGYERYEISNYAKPGFACRHNLSYWSRIDYKGFGIGAASLLNHVRSRNSTDLAAYLEGKYSLESEEPLSRSEELEETMFLGLRKMEGVELTQELSAVYEAVFRDLEQKGLLIRRNGRALLTERGIDVSNYALAEFLLDEGEAV
jgi:oxygen-independent coproporphyrinogen-3 oxidase